jgi:class 3 adenylate cyclase
VSDARIVTLLFTDLVGSTELYDRLGDETAEDLRRAHFRLLREAVTEHGGREVKNVGDGLMVVFPSAVDAVSCAVEMQQAVDRYNRRPQTLPLEVRIGLHAGEPIHDESDYFGASVNVAKRLCDVARGGQIVSSDLVRGLIGGREGFSFHSLGPLELRGISEPLIASEVLWTPSAAAAFDLPPPLVAAPRYPYVGRERERESLREHWKRAAIGERRLVLIGGEPGIGKTRIARELAMEAHAEGAIVLYGRCDSEALIPYQPFVETLRQYVDACPPSELREQIGDVGADIARLVPDLSAKVPELQAAPGEDAEVVRYRLFRSVSRLFGAAASIAPVFVVLDDLHWADAPTLALLKHVVRGEPAPILVVATYRDVEVGRRHPLAEVLALLHREHIGERLALRGLSEGEVVSFIAVAAEHELDSAAEAFARALHSETHGNPFFIEEILLHLVESGRLFQDERGRWRSNVRTIEALDIPDGIREAVERRVARLSDDADIALAQAAVLGPDFSYDVLRQMTGMDDDRLLGALEEALNAQLLVEVGEGAAYTFTHALVRQVLYETPAVPRRQRLHARAAQAIEAVHGEDTPPGAVALHYRAAGPAADPQKAIDTSLAASRAASAVFAYEDAAAHLDAALQLMDVHRSDPSLRARLLGAYADLMFVTGLDYGKGVERLEQALAIFEELGDDFGAGSIRSRLGRALSTFDAWMDIDRALEHFRAAENVLVQGPEGAPLCHTYVGLASAALYGLRNREGLEASARAMEIADGLGREALWATAAMLHGWHTVASGRLAAGTDLLVRAWETAERLEHPTNGFFSSWLLAFIAEGLLDPRAGVAWCERELSSPRAAEAPTQRDILRLHLDILLAMAGELAPMRDAEEPLGADAPIVSNVRRQFLTYFDGEWDACIDVLKEEHAHRRAAGNWLELGATGRTFVTALRTRGELERVEAVMRESLDHAVAGGVVYREVVERPEIAAALAVTGRSDDAHAEVARCRQIMANGEDWRGLAGWVDWAEGVVAAHAGRASEADGFFRRAADTLHTYESAWEEAETYYWWGRTLRDNGDRASASDRFDAATAIYERIEARRPFIDRVRSARNGQQP